MKTREHGRVPAITVDPDIANPRFPEPSDISNQTLFPMDLLHSSSIISTPISQTPGLKPSISQNSQ